MALQGIDKRSGALASLAGLACWEWVCLGSLVGAPRHRDKMQVSLSPRTQYHRLHWRPPSSPLSAGLGSWVLGPHSVP